MISVLRNCLFRALAQQLDGPHGNFRQRAVEHIRANSADYVPFMDEDTSFESYGEYLCHHKALYCVTWCHVACSNAYNLYHTVDELSKDGTFAGNDAIVAVSRACEVNIVIHQLGAPRWEVRSPIPTDKTVHIAYLRGEHYCSVQPLHPAQTLPPLVRTQYSWMCCAAHLPLPLPPFLPWPQSMRLVVMS